MVSRIASYCIEYTADLSGIIALKGEPCMTYPASYAELIEKRDSAMQDMKVQHAWYRVSDLLDMTRSVFFRMTTSSHTSPTP